MISEKQNSSTTSPHGLRRDPNRARAIPRTTGTSDEPPRGIWLPAQKKVRLSFGLALLGLFVVGIVSYRSVTRLREDTTWVIHTRVVIESLGKTLSCFVDAETGLRGYIITGDTKYLEPYNNAVRDVGPELQRLRQLTVDNPIQRRRLDVLGPLADERLALMSTAIQKRRDEGFAAAKEEISGNRGQQVHDQIRAVIKEMEATEQVLLKKREPRWERSSVFSRIIIIFGGISSLIIAGVALFLINQDFARSRNAELALQQGRDQLEARVVERTRELTQSNESLRASEERFRLLVSGAKDYCMFMLDPQGRVTNWNAGAQRLKGWEAEEIVGQPFAKLHSPQEIADGIPEKELEIARAQGQFEVKAWRSRKDGTKFWADVLIAAVYDEEGHLSGFVNLVRDLTESRRIEQAIQKQEARLAAVIGSAMDAVVTVDENQLVTLFNPAAEKMFLCSAVDAMGRSLDRFIPQRYRGIHGSHVRTFGETNTSRRRMGEMTPIYGLRSNGDEFPIEASISQVQIGEQHLFSVILRDITERKLAEEELRQQASLLNLASVLVRDMDNRIVLWSSGFHKLYGFSKQEAEGRISHELLFSQFLQPLEEIEKTLHQTGGWEGEVLHRTRDGSQISVASKWVLHRDASGKPVRILEVNTDITSRKNTERMHLRSQKMEALGTLSGGIAHDFNNILLAIFGNTKLAIADLPADHPVQESLAEISKATTRASEMVNRILSFSRPQEQKRVPLQLQPVVEEALKLVRAIIPTTIQILSEFAPGIPTASGDPSQLHQIIVNLATNAAHAIGSRAGRVDLRVEPVSITDELAKISSGLRQGRYVHISVSDNGCGMDRATLDRIFDPFFTTKPAGQGTGLGLSVVHSIVTNYGGAITAYSEPGKGSVFHVYFPASNGEAEKTVAAATTISRYRREHVLYVDDEEALVLVTRRTLERVGYKVSGFTSAPRALDAFRANPNSFDVVVSDLTMPAMSGFQLARELFSLRPNIPILIMSGNIPQEEQERAREMGIRGLIQKPDTNGALSRALDQIFHVDGPLARPFSP